MPRKKQEPMQAETENGVATTPVFKDNQMHGAKPSRVATNTDRAPIPVKSLEFQRPVKIPGYPSPAPGVTSGPGMGGGEWSIHYIPAPHPWARHYRVRHERGDVVQERYFPAGWCSGETA